MRFSTTAMAARSTGRPILGHSVSQTYFGVSNERLAALGSAENVRITSISKDGDKSWLAAQRIGDTRFNHLHRNNQV